MSELDKEIVRLTNILCDLSLSNAANSAFLSGYFRVAYTDLLLNGTSDEKKKKK